MTPILLKTFELVVHEGSALRASKIMGCTQSNITARIRQLEDTLGIPLFERQGKRLVVNSAGRQLLSYSSRIIGLINEAELAVRQTSVAGVALSIGAMESTAATRLVSIIAGIKRQHPESTVSIQIGTEVPLTQAILDDRLDAVFTACAFRRKGITYTPFFIEKIVVISACNLSTEALLQSQQVNLLAFPEGCFYRQLAEDWLLKHQFSIKEIHNCHSYALIISSVSAGMGIAIVPKNIVTQQLLNNELMAHELSDLKPITTYLLTKTKHTGMPQVVNVLDELKRYAEV